jgi:hypothetical protein
MYFPGPSLVPLVVYEDISKVVDSLTKLPSLSGGIGVYGSAAAYALVWELGSKRLKKPGPKTMWGINRYGKRRIFSTQAPGGYVGILEDEFWPIIEEEIMQVDFLAKDAGLRLEIALDNASQKIAQLVRQYAPVDSGDLRSQIYGIDTDEADILLASSDLESAGTLII